jgi:spore germination protein KC
MTLSHRRILLISEEVATKEGIYHLFDETARVPENRLTGYVIITQGKAVDMLGVQPKFERLPAEAIRKLAKGGGTLIINLKNVARSLAIPGSDPVIAYMGKKKPEEAKGTKSEYQFLGFAQFREDKMVGTLGMEQSNGLAWLRKRTRPYTIGVSVSGKDKTVVSILEGQPIIRASIDKQWHPHFHIDVQARMGVLESREGLDLSKKETLDALSGKTEEAIRDQIGSVLQAIRQNRADSASFGQLLAKKYPSEWRNHILGHWREELANADISVSVKATIEQTGLITENIAKRVNQ